MRRSSPARWLSAMLWIASCSTCGEDNPPSSGLRCGEGTIEVDGVCVPASDGGQMCTPEQVEVDGECVARDAGKPDAGKPDAGPVLRCGEGTIERDGVCVLAPPPGCSTHDDCEPEEECVDGVCQSLPPEPQNPTAEENAKQGTDEWTLQNPAVGHEIEGYASLTSVDAGDSIALYVSTNALSYSIDVFRMGYYAELGGRRVLQTIERPGTIQTTPAPDADGMVECDWVEPYVLQIPTDWVSGVYLAKLTESEGGYQSYIVFVVREDDRVSDFLFQSSVTTYQAYNNWGGKSVYDFNSTGPRAWRVSFSRPYGLGVGGQDAALGIGAGEFIDSESNDTPSARAWEYPMVRFLEREGHDVSYATNLDTHLDPELLKNHKAFLSVGHDEYWSWEMRANIESARDRFGTHLGFFSGNDCYWQIRIEPGQHDEPARTMRVYKDEALDPLRGTGDAHLVTTRWALPPLELNEAGMIGVRYQEGGVYGDLIVDEARSWPLAGTGLRTGDRLPGLLGYEVDGVPDGELLGGVTRLMKSPWTTAISSGAADMVVFQVPSGAFTFGAGSIQFSWGLDEYGNRDLAHPLVSPEARRITQNLLARFTAPLRPSQTAVLMSDDFTGEVRDPLRWVPGIVVEGEEALDEGVTVVQDDQLSIIPRIHVPDVHHNGYVSATSFDMTRGMARVTVVQSPNAGSAADGSFALSADIDHWVRFNIEGPLMTLQARVGGTLSGPNVTYDPIQHRVLRLRHLVETDEFVWETSPDGAAFTILRQSSLAVPVTAMRAELEAGTYQPEPAPGTVTFDDFSVEWTGFTDEFAGPRNPQYWTPGTMSQGASAYDHELAPIQFADQVKVRPRISAQGQHFGGYVSSRAWDLRDGTAQVELEQVAAGDSATLFALGIDAQNWVRFRVQAGTLYLEDNVAGAQTQTSVAHDPVAHRHLRFSHDRSPAELRWETSPNATVWTSRRSKAPPLPVTALRAELAAGTSGPEPAPDEAVFESFELHTALY
jgi:hypothetical protein